MATKLVSMKMTRAEREEKSQPAEVSQDTPSYPYGLVVRLDNDALEKLDLKKLPAVGSKMALIAVVEVTSVSMNESESGSNKNLELQITDLCLEKGGDKSTADTLYDGNQAEK